MAQEEHRGDSLLWHFKVNLLGLSLRQPKYSEPTLQFSELSTCLDSHHKGLVSLYTWSLTSSDRKCFAMMCINVCRGSKIALLLCLDSDVFPFSDPGNSVVDYKNALVWIAQTLLCSLHATISCLCCQSQFLEALFFSISQCKTATWKAVMNQVFLCAVQT